jgi:hypothetical protein
MQEPSSMTDLLRCLFHWCGCNHLGVLLLDIVGPVILDVVVIGFVFDQLLKYRERRRWRPAKRVLQARLAKLQDEIRLELVPTEFKRPEVREAHFGGMRITLLFQWRSSEMESDHILAALDNYLRIKRETVHSTMVEMRFQVNQIITAHASHLEPQQWNWLLRIDSGSSDLAAATATGKRLEENGKMAASVAKSLIDQCTEISKTLRAAED